MSSSLSSSLSSFLSRSSSFSRATSFVLLFLHLSSWLTPLTIAWFSLTPGFFWPPHLNLWTAFTGWLLEPSVIILTLDLVVLLLTSQLLEPLWGTLEMVVFMLTVNVLSYVMAASFLFVLFMITEEADLLFSTHVQGMSAYVVGLLVATKQIMPDLMLIKLPVVGKIYNRHLPLLLVVLFNLLVPTGLTDGVDALLADNGLLVSWVYLRFYQVHNNGARGDMADAFAFATFFPNVVQPVVAKVANLLFDMAVKVGVCDRPLRQYNMAAANPEATISIALPGSSGVTQDSERRRQIALKALSARLNSSPPIELGSIRTSEETTDSKPQWPEVGEEKKKKEADEVLVDIDTNNVSSNNESKMDDTEKEETKLEMTTPENEEV